MTGPLVLPPEIEQVADLRSKQRPEVCDLFRFALVLAMIDDEKARVIGTRVDEGREWLTVETLAGDAFEIARPPISEDVEAELMRHVRGIIMDEEGDGSWRAPPIVACDDYGFQGSVAFNFSFFFLQLVFYSIIVYAFITATRWYESKSLGLTKTDFDQPIILNLCPLTLASNPDIIFIRTDVLMVAGPNCPAVGVLLARVNPATTFYAKRSPRSTFLHGLGCPLVVRLAAPGKTCPPKYAPEPRCRITLRAATGFQRRGLEAVSWASSPRAILALG
jgi:hypothetical protein